MEKEIFKENFVGPSLLVLVIIGIAVVSITKFSLPWWGGLLALFVAGFIILLYLKSKVVIENGEIRYEKLGSIDEVALKHVHEIITREVETIVDKSNNHGRKTSGGGSITIKGVTLGGGQAKNQRREVKRYMYINDYDGRTIFSFPAKMIGRLHRRRFIEAVHQYNPNIEIH